MKNLALLLLALTFTVSTQSNAQTQFIKYKKYLIPISSGCAGISNLPHIFYIDDIGDSRINALDPNSVQELPIVLGFAKRNLFNLVGFGTASNPQNQSNIDASFAQGLVNKAEIDPQNPEFPPVLQGDALENAIIAEALKFKDCSGRKLQIAVGGHWIEC